MKISNDISVVIPTYNGSKFIAETVKSVFSQMLLPKEIIIVDDVSTDNTKEIIKGLQDVSPVPLHFIQLDKNSGGPAKPINVGVEKAKGEYIAICEQDDLMLPSKIKMIDKFIKLEPDIPFIISRYKVLVSNNVKCAISDDSYSEFESIKKICLKEPYFYLDKRSAYKKALEKCFAASLSNICFSKSLWYELGGLNEDIKRAVDWDLLLKVTHNYDIGWINKKLWEFRRHSESTVRKTDILMWGNDYINIWLYQLESSRNSKDFLYVREKFNEQLAGIAYWARQKGAYRFSLRCYIRQLFMCRNFYSIIDLIKLGILFIIKK